MKMALRGLLTDMQTSCCLRQRFSNQARIVTPKFQNYKMQALHIPSTFRYCNIHQYHCRMQLSPCKFLSRCRTFHTSTTTSAFGIHEVADALSHHPAIVAVTGGGSLGLASLLYRSPAFWKLIATASTDRSVLLLPPKPSHSLQSRKTEIRKLDAMFKLLRKQNRSAVSVTVYVTGRPGYGKTQLAREFGKEYYRKKKGFIFKTLFVGTLNAASKSSFLQSYITLALELGCTSELKVLEDLSGKKGELQSLELLAATVRKELKKRPGWLLIVDNLSSDVNPSINAPPSFSELLPAVSPATLPFSPPGQGMLKGDAYSPGFGIAAAYGVGSYRAAWRSFWPQSGDESWGKGYVLVTTNDRRLVEKSNPFVSELFLSNGMVESDAVSLLEKVSECKGEGAREVVTALDKAPLSIASAGFYISAERSRNPSYSFHDYLKGFEKDIQTEGEKMLLCQNLSYPITMTMAVSMATQQLATDPHLHKVFLLLSSCAQSPVPMSLIAKVLSVRPDINSAVLESVRNCALLFFPKSHDQSLHGSSQQLSFVGDDIETVSVYRGTREVFRELLLGETVTKSEATPSPETASVQQRNSMLRQFIDCLVQEYEAARFSDSVSSYRMRHLLLPHMEAHLQAGDRVPGFHLDAQREIDLCYSLGNGFLLVGRPRKAREVLERALKVCEDSGGKNSIQAADIASNLGRTYRHLAMLKESEFVLEEALRVYEKKSGEVSVEVAGALTNLSSTYKHRGLYHNSRKCLEQALEIYEKLYHSKHPSVAHVLTNLGATWRNLGDSTKSKELFEKALAIQEELYEPYHPAIAVTLGNLSVAYSDLGQPQKGIELLQRALEINRHVHNPDHFSVAITLSNLSIAYRHLGDVSKSKELAMEALRKTEATHGHTHPGVAITLGILGTTYSDLGELTKAQELLESSVEINKAINGLRHAGTAIAQTQLGRVMRLGGKLQDAKQILETALETKENVYGMLHPGIGVTLNSLGKVYHELGYLTQSQLAFLRSQSIGEKLYHNNPDHPQIAFGKSDLAKVIRDCGDVQRSAEMMQDAIDHYTETSTQSDNPCYTTAHPKYASMLAIMGLILRDLDDLKGAKKHLEKALRIQQKILSQQNLMKADTVCTLGTVLHRLGEKQKALDELNSALAMMQSTCYENPVTSTISGAIGTLLLDMGEVHSAKHCLREALKIRTKCCGEIHPAVAYYHKLLADVEKEDTSLRAQHLQTSRQIYRALCEREHMLSEEAGVQLPVIIEWRKKLEELEHQLK